MRIVVNIDRTLFDINMYLMLDWLELPQIYEAIRGK